MLEYDDIHPFYRILGLQSEAKEMDRLSNRQEALLNDTKILLNGSDAERKEVQDKMREEEQEFKNWLDSQNDDEYDDWFQNAQ
jgi:hypothetical protein